MPRINEVKKARKDQGECSGCGKPIVAGQPYKYIEFRFGPRRVKCDECRFRPSELTQSKMSGALSAQEQCEDAIAGFNGVEAEGDVSDLRQALEDAASEIRDVGQEYRDSADAINSTAEGSSTAQDCEEKADALEQWADDIEQSANELEDCDHEMPEELDEDATDEQREAYKKAREEREAAVTDWAEEQTQKAGEAIGDCPV